MLQSFNVTTIHQQDKLEPYNLLICNIYKGKTNQKDLVTILQAKSVCHKDLNFCEQRALAIYLFSHFCIHDEEFDLSKNSNLMKVQTTVSVKNIAKQFEKSRKTPMTSGLYYEKLAFIFNFFGYNVSHVIHFGRSCAPVLLEFAEVLTQTIEQLDNWNTTVYHQSYFLNLP